MNNNLDSVIARLKLGVTFGGAISGEGLLSSVHAIKSDIMQMFSVKLYMAEDAEEQQMLDLQMVFVGIRWVYGCQIVILRRLPISLAHTGSAFRSHPYKLREDVFK